MQALKDIGESQQSRYPPVSRIVYGEVPSGYCEPVEARLLVRGEKYCVVA